MRHIFTYIPFAIEFWKNQSTVFWIPRSSRCLTAGPGMTKYLTSVMTKYLTSVMTKYLTSVIPRLDRGIQRRTRYFFKCPKFKCKCYKFFLYFVIYGLVILLTSCAGLPNHTNRKDGPPLIPKPMLFVKNATPKIEPKSRSGNPKSYVIKGKKYHVKKSDQGHTERGYASWYGTKFHGRKTSSGERYDMFAMTAAHKTLPIPTYVRVKNLRNGKAIIVKVNDRGPFVSGRIIDLSYAAAKKLEIYSNGTDKVEITSIDPQKWKKKVG